MTDYTSIPDTWLGVDKPARSVDAKALRDNPIAMFEGAPGAPRLAYGAWSKLVAGDTLTAAGPDSDAELFGLGDSGTTLANAHGFHQSGTVRFKCLGRTSGGETGYFRLRYLRAGTLYASDLQSTTSTSNALITFADVTVQAGDLWWVTPYTGSPETSGEYTWVSQFRIYTDGSTSFIPAAQHFGYVYV